MWSAYVDVMWNKLIVGAVSRLSLINLDLTGSIFVTFTVTVPQLFLLHDV